MTAGRVADRVEEYRYFSHSVGDVRPLTVRHLTVRISKFHKVHKEANKAPKAPSKGKRR